MLEVINDFDSCWFDSRSSSGALTCAEATFIRDVVGRLRFCARRRLAFDIQPPSISVRPLPSAAGYVVIDTKTRARYEFPLVGLAQDLVPMDDQARLAWLMGEPWPIPDRAEECEALEKRRHRPIADPSVRTDAHGLEIKVTPLTKRSTRRKAIQADAGMIAGILRSWHHDIRAQAQADLAYALIPRDAPSPRVQKLRDRLVHEWLTLAAKPKRLVRCRSPRCHVFSGADICASAGAYFFPRTSEKDCPQCRSKRNHVSRWRDQCGQVKTIEAPHSGRRVITAHSRGKR